jgi:hypothetical protein
MSAITVVRIGVRRVLAAWTTAAVLLGLALPGSAFAAQAPITGTRYVREGKLRFALPTEPNDEVYLESCLTSCNSPGQMRDELVVVTGYESESSTLGTTNSAQMCGGSRRNSVYDIGSSAPPSAQSASLQ